MARMSHVLDTNICIHLIRQRSPQALRKFEEFEVGEIGVSVVTVSELRYGVHRSARVDQNREALDRFLLPLEVMSFDLEATESYGRIRAALEKHGTPIGPLDTLIAAHVLSRGATLVTNKTHEFGRMPELRIEDWTVP